MPRADIQNEKRGHPGLRRGGPKRTDAEVEYVREHYGKMSQNAMARELGRARSFVQRIVGELGLAESKVTVHPEEPEVPEPRDEDTLSRLKHLRRILWRNILECDTRSLAQLSKEYRAITQEIDTIERADGGGGNADANALDALVDAIGRKLSS